MEEEREERREFIEREGNMEAWGNVKTLKI